MDSSSSSEGPLQTLQVREMRSLSNMSTNSTFNVNAPEFVMPQTVRTDHCSASPNHTSIGPFGNENLHNNGHQMYCDPRSMHTHNFDVHNMGPAIPHYYPSHHTVPVHCPTCAHQSARPYPLVSPCPQFSTVSPHSAANAANGVFYSSGRSAMNLSKKSNSRSGFRVFVRVDSAKCNAPMPNREIVHEHFSQYGRVIDCYLPDSATNVAYVCFEEEDTMELVLALCDDWCYEEKEEPFIGPAVPPNPLWVNGTTPVLVSKASPRPDYNIDTDRLFIKCIPDGVYRSDIRNYFELNFGKVLDVYIPRDKITGLNKRYAFVTFCNRAVSQTVLRHTDMVHYIGPDRKPVQVMPAESRPKAGNTGSPISPKEASIPPFSPVVDVKPRAYTIHNPNESIAADSRARSPSVHETVIAASQNFGENSRRCEQSSMLSSHPMYPVHPFDYKSPPHHVHHVQYRAQHDHQMSDISPYPGHHRTVFDNGISVQRSESFSVEFVDDLIKSLIEAEDEVCSASTSAGHLPEEAGEELHQHSPVTCDSTPFKADRHVDFFGKDQVTPAADSPLPEAHTDQVVRKLTDVILAAVEESDNF